MRNTKSLILTVITAFVLAVSVLVLSGCAAPSDVQELSRGAEPLRVRRADGKVESITFAQAMAWHHKHEAKGHADAVTSATPTAKKSTSHHGHEKDDHDDGLCVGVATGYQAIRYAAGRLFPNEIPNASDLELSVAGAMRGVWDILSLHAGKKLTRPKMRQKRMSLESFTFTAKRVSTGETITFRLRTGLIPSEFFALKNRGVTCGDPALEALKKQAARKILSISPAECFESIAP